MRSDGIHDSRPDTDIFLNNLPVASSPPRIPAKVIIEGKISDRSKLAQIIFFHNSMDFLQLLMRHGNQPAVNDGFFFVSNFPKILTYYKDPFQSLLVV